MKYFKIFLLVKVLSASLALSAHAKDLTNIVQPSLPNCDKIDQKLTFENKHHWNGWGSNITNTRHQPESIGQISARDLGKIRIKWAYGFPGSTKVDAQPTVFGNRIFSSGGTNTIHSIDLDTGCKLWSTTVYSRVRSTIVAGEVGKNILLFFGDQAGWAYALDASNGRKVWSKKIDSHNLAQVTGSPVFHNSIVYFPASSGWEEAAAANSSYDCCTFRGSISALNAADGSTRWKTYTISEHAKKVNLSKGRYGPSGAGVWSSPTIDVDKDRIYITTGNNFSLPATETSDSIIALSLDSGRILWTKQILANDVTNVSCYVAGQPNCPFSSAPDHDFGSSAILLKLEDDKRLLLAGQKSGVVTAIDPDKDGAIVWQRRIGQGSPLGGIQFGMSTDGRHVYAANSFMQHSKSSSSVRGAQPGVDDWYLLGSRGGGIHALDVRNGDIKWSRAHPGCNQTPGCSQAQSAAVTSTDSFVLSGGLDGILRAYSVINGEILWEVDTKVSVKGSNGTIAKGGALDGPGPVIVSGIMLVNSGYQMFGGVPGNALFAFHVEKD
jgi:polyvinyl alcohol dehydrogenase (cytochrome)